MDDFAIEVELFSATELAAQLTRMVQDYRHFHIDGDDIEVLEREDAEKRAAHAQDIFRSMFRGLLNDESFLVQQSENEVIATVESWAMDNRPRGIDSRRHGLTIAECCETLKQYSSDSTTRSAPAIWPYIRKIK